MSSFLDAELLTLAHEVLAGKNAAEYPVAISLEKKPLGLYVWRVWLEHNGIAVDSEAQEPSIAVATALRQLRYAKA